MQTDLLSAVCYEPGERIKSNQQQALNIFNIYEQKIKTKFKAEKI